MQLMAQHYKGKIDTWIIWNEVDISHGQWAPGTARSRTTSSFRRSPTRRSRPATRTPRCCRSARPGGTTTATRSPGCWTAARPIPTRRRTTTTSTSPTCTCTAAPPTSRGSSAGTATQLAARGMSKPIWIGETNAIPYDDPIWQRVEGELPRHDGRAGVVHHPGVRDLRRAGRAAGERQPGHRRHRLRGRRRAVRPAPQRRLDRPAFTAYQVATRYFAGVREATYATTMPAASRR